MVTAWVVDQAGPETPERDWAALSAVLVGAVSHYWLLRDVFGQHPAGIFVHDAGAFQLGIGVTLRLSLA